MKIYKKILLVTLILFPVIFATAQTQDWDPLKEVDESSKIKNFQNYLNVPNIDIKTPTQIEVYLDSSQLKNSSIGVFDKSTKQFVYNRVLEYKTIPTPIAQVTDFPTGQMLYNLFDNNLSTYSNFYLNGNNNDQTKIRVYYPKPLKTSSVTINLDRNVALPSYVTISSRIGSKIVVLLNKYRPTGNVINFPETEAQEWIIEIDYSQPLRITEINFKDAKSSVDKKGVNFIALPNHTYSVYANPEVSFSAYSGKEVPNIYNNNFATKVSETPLELSVNPDFVEIDTDSDMVPNSKDNCPSVSNSDQTDINNNKVGDLCEDYDKDNILNYVDNCQEVSNYNQKDTDGDKIGDLCDPDESRLTEKYPFIVWGALLFACLIFIVLLYNVADKIRKQNSNTEPPTTGFTPNNANQ